MLYIEGTPSFFVDLGLVRSNVLDLVHPTKLGGRLVVLDDQGDLPLLVAIALGKELRVDHRSQSKGALRPAGSRA